MHRRLACAMIVAILGLSLFMPTLVTAAQTGRSRTKQRRALIYLAKELKETDREDPKNPGNLHPLPRQVNAAAPLRASLQALLAGPTATEKRRGFMDIGFGLSSLRSPLKTMWCALISPCQEARLSRATTRLSCSAMQLNSQQNSFRV
jgi:hypothetical protein